MEAFVILFDVAVVAFAVWVARRLRAPRPTPLDNWQPGDDSARARRIALYSKVRR